MLRDLDQMKAMTDGVLSFLRDGQTREAPPRSISPACCKRSATSIADMGHDVAYEGPDHATITARPDDLQRAVANLVDNAVRHGATRRGAARGTRGRGRPSRWRTTAPAFPTTARPRCWKPSCAARKPAPWTTAPASASACRSRAPSPRRMAAPDAARPRAAWAHRAHHAAGRRVPLNTGAAAALTPLPPCLH